MRQFWPKAELKRLGQLFGRGLSYGAISTQLNSEFGNGRTAKSVDSKLFVLKQDGELGSWLDQAKLGFLDIETSNFHADAGFMLSWAIAIPGEQQTYSDVITRQDIQRGYGDDKRILVSLVETMRKCDVVATFFGKRFDAPYLRARAISHNLSFPTYGSIVHLDLFYACRTLFKLHRRSLDAACSFLNIPGKTHLDMGIWNKARVGHTQSLQYVLEHNLADVEILAQLFDRIKPYAKWTKTSI